MLTSQVFTFTIIMIFASFLCLVATTIRLISAGINAKKEYKSELKALIICSSLVFYFSIFIISIMPLNKETFTWIGERHGDHNEIESDINFIDIFQYQVLKTRLIVVNNTFLKGVLRENLQRQIDNDPYEQIRFKSYYEERLFKDDHELLIINNDKGLFFRVQPYITTLYDFTVRYERPELLSAFRDCKENNNIQVCFHAFSQYDKIFNSGIVDIDSYNAFVINANDMTIGKRKELEIIAEKERIEAEREAVRLKAINEERNKTKLYSCIENERELICKKLENQ